MNSLICTTADCPNEGIEFFFDTAPVAVECGGCHVVYK
jgi:hypothetical protein